MPTGPLHDCWTNRVEGGEIVQDIKKCRCMIGDDHQGDNSVDADAFYGSVDDDDSSCSTCDGVSGMQYCPECHRVDSDA